MASQTLSATQTSRTTLSRLLWVGPLTILASIVAVVIIQQITVAVLQPGPAFLPLSLGLPIAFTFGAALAATVVYALMLRFAKQPTQLFQRVALVTLVVTLIPDIVLMFTGFIPGSTTEGVVALMAMHLAVCAVVVGMFTRFANSATE